MKFVLPISLAVVMALAANAGPQQSGKTKIVSTEESASAATSETATPLFPGGDPALGKFIRKSIKYSSTARARKMCGTVTVRFLVDADGSVKNAIVPEGKGIGKECDEEAIRVVMAMPKWAPATRNGAAVSYWCEIPISFKLIQVN